MKFHADEHVADAVVLGLQRRGFDATTTSVAGLIGAADDKQLAYCRRHGRVMITHDADMLRLAAAGRPHAGIAYCHNQKYKVGKLLSKLLKLAARVSEEEIKIRVEFLEVREMRTMGHGRVARLFLIIRDVSLFLLRLSQEQRRCKAEEIRDPDHV